MSRTILTIALIGFTLTLLGMDAEQPQSIFDKMSHSEVLEMTLEVSFDSIAVNRKTKNKINAHMKFVDAMGKPQSWNTEVSVRGKFRRMRCADMPPLKLNFKKNELTAAGLSTSNDLKMVTQCAKDEQEAKETLMREYLVYKMYNELTDYSYRVQLVKITFNDTDSEASKSQWAFLIEDTAQLRSRVGAEKFGKKEIFDFDQLKPEEEKTTALFQYLIGNVDWGMANRKNLKLIRNGHQLIGVPYDFDFAGIVKAPYAKANSTLGIKSRFDRLYLGNSKNYTELESTIDLFFSKKQALIKLISDFKLINREAKNDMLNYLKLFFSEGKDVEIVTNLKASR